MDKYTLSIVGIVGLVAVIGLFAVIIIISPNFSVSVPSSQSNYVGQALAPTTVKYSCSETDGGKVIEIKGTTTLTPLSIVDTKTVAASAYAVAAPKPSPISYTDNCQWYTGEPGVWKQAPYCFGANCRFTEFYCSKDSAGNAIADTYETFFGVYGQKYMTGACKDGTLAAKFFDLDAVQLSGPTTAVVGQSINLTLTITNHGNVGGYIQSGSVSVCRVGDPCAGGGGGCGPNANGTPCGTYIGPGATLTEVYQHTLDKEGIYQITHGIGGNGYEGNITYPDLEPNNNAKTINISVQGSNVISGSAYLGENIVNSPNGFPAELTVEQLNFLQKSSVNLNGVNYKYHDTIALSNIPNALTLQTSLTAHDYNFGSGEYLTAAEGSLMYCYIFDDDIPLASSLNQAADFRIDFMGKQLHLWQINSDTSFTAEVGTRYFLNAGTSAVVEPVTITLLRVSDTAAVFDVNGVTRTINVNSVLEINGVKIHLEAVFNDVGTSYDSARFTVEKSKEYYLTTNTPTNIGGHTVTLLFVSDTSAVFNVDYTNASIMVGETKTMNGVDISLTSVFNDVGVANDSVMIYAGVPKEYSLITGGAALYGQVMTLERVSDTAAVVSVDGTSLAINVGNTEEVNGLQVQVISVYNDDGTANDAAMLLAGADVVKTFNDGDAYIGQTNTHPDWVWKLVGLTTAPRPKICVRNAFEKVIPDDWPMGVGGAYSFPNNFADLKFTEVQPSDTQYSQVKMKYMSNVNLGSTFGVASVMKLTGPFVIPGKGITSAIYIRQYYNTTLYYYEDADGIIQLGGNAGGTFSKTIATVVLPENPFPLNLNLARELNAPTLTVELATTATPFEVIGARIGIGNAVTSLGTSPGVAEPTESYYALSGAMFPIGLESKDLRTAYGTIIRSPSNNSASDQVVLDIPNSKVLGKFSVLGMGTASGGGGSGGVGLPVPMGDLTI